MHVENSTLSLPFSEFSEETRTEIRFIDLFAGIGGFHFAFEGLKAEFPNISIRCVFASERDDAARKTYEHNFRKHAPELFKNGRFNKDITIDPNDPKEIPNYDTLIPKFEILCAGFPCQPFSHAGFKKGFGDPRGTLFGNIAAIIESKKPEAYLLENVSHLFKHDNGKTFKTIRHILKTELKYSFHPLIIRASDFGLPQHRPRLFMVGFKNDANFNFPKKEILKSTMSDIFGATCERDIGFTLRVGGRRSGIHDRRNWDTYLVDGKERFLGPDEGIKMMGLPKSFRFPKDLSETQKMKQLGNSVAVPVVRAIAREIIKEILGAQSR